MSRDHRSAGGDRRQAGWVRRHPAGHLQRGCGGSGTGSIPSIPPTSLRRQRGMGCAGKMAAPQRPAALAQARQCRESSQAPRALRGWAPEGMRGGLLPGSILSPHPIAARWGSPRPVPSAAPGTAPSRGRWHWVATPVHGVPPTCTSGPAHRPALSGHSHCMRPLGPELKQREAPSAPTLSPRTHLSSGAWHSPREKSASYVRATGARCPPHDPPHPPRPGVARGVGASIHHALPRGNTLSAGGGTCPGRGTPRGGSSCPAIPRR